VIAEESVESGQGISLKRIAYAVLRVRPFASMKIQKS